MDKTDKTIFTVLVILGLVLVVSDLWAIIILLPPFCFCVWGVHIIPIFWKKVDDEKKE